MIKRIELKNFMSHPHTVIELAEGLTVLVGENNSGKSALITALQVLCRNAKGPYMVRHGAQDCLVKVETTEGDVFKWGRKKGSVYYVINDKPFHRLKGAVPDDLDKLLQLPMVKTDNGEFEVHFGEQKSPIFLLNQSEGKQATFFASSSDTVRLIEMQKLHRKKVKDAKGEKTKLLKQKAQFEARLESLEPIDELEGRLIRLESEYEAIGQEQKIISNLIQMLDDLCEAQEVFSRYFELERVVGSLNVPPSIEPVESLERLINDLDDVNVTVNRESSCLKRLELMEKPPILEDVSQLEAVIERLDGLLYEVKESEAINGVMAELEGIPSLVDISDLIELIKNIDGLQGQVKKGKAIGVVIDELEGVPELVNTSNLVELIEQIEFVNGNELRFRDEVDCLGKLIELPSLTDVEYLRELIINFEKLYRQIEGMGARYKLLEGCERYPEILETRGLENLILGIEDSLTDVEKFEAYYENLDKVLLPPKVVDSYELISFINEIEESELNVIEIEEVFDGAKDLCDKAEEDLRIYIEQIGVCPTCGEKLDVEYFLASRDGGR